ncbi:hypothetical protein QVD17_01646 [Tagetes erecta]|uniref:CCT domain-containing protein n=1 Tax=Tagetes erecta TaxID=13708 RepID=A0AAD8P831_TARER|nr:hypothetical protein QVD17_01646 [Tagetes erecta]
MSRHERILRYFEKKKSRKYVKKIIHSSRKAYARSRPRGSLQPTGAGINGIMPEANFGTMNLPREWALNQFPFSPFHPGNLTEEKVGIHSNSTKRSSLGTQQQNSKNGLKKSSQLTLASKQEKILRYVEKKKSRKYEKKIIHSSRTTYAQTRPRVQGRFARNSQANA